MTPETKQSYCNHHFEFAKHLGIMERALSDIDNKINKLFGLIEKGRDKNDAQDNDIYSLKGYVKAHGFQIVIAISLISIAIKLWRGQ